MRSSVGYEIGIPLLGHVLIHFILVDTSSIICWTRLFVILGRSGLFCCFYSIFMENPVCKQCRPRSDVASDLGRHYWPMTLLRVSR